MTIAPFTGNFTQQEAISDSAIDAAIEVLRSGRLHRYNTAGDEVSQTAQLEAEYAAWQGSKYCLACTSGGYALSTALKAAGLKVGERVLTNAFTLAPVPGAIVNAGGVPIFVEVTDSLVVDLDDLALKAVSSGARFFMLSHMRGHLADMDRLMEIVQAHDLILIEDCAHTMGAKWDGKKSGSYGLASCFSTQTYKHVNSGEGGFITSDSAELMARAIMLSGSYMLYERHGASPDPSVFADIRLETPNCSGRMDNLRAAILRPQLAELDTSVERWNERYQVIERRLSAVSAIEVPVRPEKEYYVGSSLQFLIKDINDESARLFIQTNKALGVELKWFGDHEPHGYTSNHKSWQYTDSQSLPVTDRVLSGLFDIRVPLTFSLQDCEHLAEVIAHCAESLLNPAA
ncbi:MAG TPA: DegT/DnrJ/EryC1/StrS family aminotransferase [Arenicellales bacterium]|jgi:dTDP-4-amino-4,6-dideoxygalactose transaminase|nr:aminotransferase [Chloroflexota bacterium]HJP07438.1 DegT/DnrJ/EryC1/StrS family aminotransferase [Arenicellales bacterium]|tara:strand:- start:2067 stop:3272 length:1206 start_codon:yes stop_codon:yes gene_type:complete